MLQSVEGLEFVFDTANMLPNGEDPQESYEKLKGRISHVHLKDVVLLPWEHLPKHAEYTPDGKLMVVVVWGEGLIPVQSIYQKECHRMPVLSFNQARTCALTPDVPLI